MFVAERAVERVFEDIAQRKEALELAVFVHDDEAVNARFADCVEDGVEAVVEGAGVDAGEVLPNVLVLSFVVS